MKRTQDRAEADCYGRIRSSEGANDCEDAKVSLFVRGSMRGGKKITLRCSSDTFNRRDEGVAG